MNHNFYSPFDLLDDKVLPSEDDLSELNLGVVELENILSDLLPAYKDDEPYK